MLNGLSLFSGIGGIDVALSESVRPVAYCEIDPYCQAVLLNRQAKGDLQRAPIWDDVRTFPTEGLREFVDVVYAGFPCQDISFAGNGKGLAGERSGLFFEILRLAKEIQPSFIFLENVPAITSRGGLTVVRAIAEMGYDCRWCVISAASVGAYHKRDRWFLLAHAKHFGSYVSQERRGSEEAIYDNAKGKHQARQFEGGDQSGMLASKPISNSHPEGLEGRDNQKPDELSSSIGSDSTTPDPSSLRLNQMASQGIHPERQAEFDEKSSDLRGSSDVRRPTADSYSTSVGIGESVASGRPLSAHSKCDSPLFVDWENSEPPVCGVASRISNRVDRIRGLGNAVVPKQAKEAFEILMGLK